MNHLSEEELIEQYYSRDDTGAGGHLAACAECAETYAELKSDLAAMQTAAPPARDAAYG